jgi:HEAT repeat protein
MIKEQNNSDTKSQLVNLEEVLANLQHPDSDVRLRAVRDLISMQDGSTVERLNQLLETETDVQICYEIRKGIGILRQAASSGQSPSPPDFSKNLKKVQSALEGDEEERCNRAFRYIVQYRLKQFLPTLEEHCQKKPSSYRKGLLIRLMVSLGGELYFQSLVSFLNDEDPRVISTAIEALEGIGNTKALGFIAQFVTHANNRVQATAMKALYNLGDQSALKLFRKMVASPHVAYRNSAAYALKEMKIPDSIPLLKLLFQDEDQSVKDKGREGLTHLREVGNEEAKKILEDAPESELEDSHDSPDSMTTPELMDWIRDCLDPNDPSIVQKLVLKLDSETDERLVASLIMALARLGDPEQYQRLLPFLQSDVDRVRANAVEGLGILLNKVDKKTLIPSLEDVNNRVVGNAIIALIHDYPKQAVQGLEGLSQSSTLNEQLTAVYCIGAIGEDELLRYSEFLLESPFTEVREKMVKVLEDLSQDSATALRMVKAWQLRIASFEPGDSERETRSSPDDTQSTQKEQEPQEVVSATSHESVAVEAQLPSEEEVHESPAPTQPEAVAEEISPDEKEAKPTKRRLFRGRKASVVEPDGQRESSEDELSADFFIPESPLERFSAAGFFIILAFMGLTNLCSALIQDRFTFHRIFSMPLHTLLVNEVFYSAFFIVIIPAFAAWFLAVHKFRYLREPFLLSFLIGVFLHQYVQIVDTMNVEIAPFLSFLSHYSATYYMDEYSGNSRWAIQILNLPWLLFPVAIEGLVRLSGFRRGLVGILFFFLILSTIWLIFLDRFASEEITRTKVQTRLNHLRYQREEVEGLLSQGRLEILSLQARRIKALTKEQSRYLSGKLQRLKSVTLRHEKLLLNLKQRILRIEDQP